MSSPLDEALEAAAEESGEPLGTMNGNTVEKLTMVFAGGGSLSGYLIDTDFEELKARFGEPESMEKSRVHYTLRINGEVVTIYDYKNSEPLEDVTTWHVGGSGLSPLDRVAEVFGAERVRSGRNNPHPDYPEIEW